MDSNRPSHPLKQETRRVFVSVKMHDGDRFRGYVHLAPGERIQDLLNDERKFFPIQMNSDVGEMAILSKKFVVSVEEVDDNKARSFAFS